MTTVDSRAVSRPAWENPQPRATWGGYAEQQMMNLIVRMAPAARKSHGCARLDGRPLNELFDEPRVLMDALLTHAWVDIENPRDSRLLRELSSFPGLMYTVFTVAEKEIILDWLDELRRTTAPTRPPTGPGATSAARPGHEQGFLVRT